VKQTLPLKLSPHLTLPPQLQQSIRLLQLSTLELNAEVERMLQENPLLEKDETEGEDEPPQEFPLATRERPAEAEHEHHAHHERCLVAQGRVEVVVLGDRATDEHTRREGVAQAADGVHRLLRRRVGHWDHGF